MLELSKLNLKLGNKTLISDFSYQILSGSFTCLVGANGSGKSTLLKLLAGIVIDFQGQRLAAADLKISYHGHNSGLYSDLTVLENLQLFSSLLGFHYEISEVLEFWKLTDLDQLTVSSLSKGQEQRLALAVSLSTKADLFLLDEPDSNLDSNSHSILMAAISKLKENSNKISFVISTHNPEKYQQYLSSELKLGDPIEFKLGI